jgi:hypothetical protein
MGGHNGENNNESNAVVLFNDGNGLKELQSRGDVAVGPSGDKERRGNRVDALAGDVRNLKNILTTQAGIRLWLIPFQGWARLRSG